MPGLSSGGSVAKEKWFEIGFVSESVLDDVAVTDPTDTTEQSIVVTLPTDAVIVNATLIVLVTVMNDSATAQKLTLAVKIKKSTGSYGDAVWTQTNCIGFGNVDGATVSLTPLGDASSIVDVAATYNCKCTVTISSANSVHVTTQYILIVTYKITG